MTATAAVPPPDKPRIDSLRDLPRLLLLLICFFLAGASARAQDAAAAPRPRIGLVLSGGGARGIAHVGVLRWLEQHRIPVDVVAGTSMGGLVGGLYAAGLPPDEMLTLVQSADWNQALSGVPSYYDLSFRRKEDRRAVPSDIEFGISRGKLQGRSGLNPGHEIGLIFNRATLPYGDNIRFEDLPIPFRCVATDMVAGKEVVLDSGSLSTALRGTMAIPGVFTLVRRNGILLGDGGLMNNIPTDIAKQMGADIIIAVNVGTPLSDESTLATIGGVLQQSIAVMSAENQRRNLLLAQVVLTPDLTGFGSFDFERSTPLVERGYESAEQSAGALTPLALGESEWQTYIASRRARRKTAVPVPSFVTVTGASRNGAPLVQQRLKAFIGKPIRTEKLENELNQLRAQGGYDTLSYEITRRPDDPTRAGLLVRVGEKPYAPPFLYPAFIIDGGTAQNRSDIAVVSRVVTPNLDSNGAETRYDFALGSYQRLAGEYYRPVRKGGPRFVAARVSFDQNIQDYFETGARVAQYRLQRVGLGLDTGYTYLRSEIRASYEAAYLNAAVVVGNPDLPQQRGTEQSAVLRYAFDSQDSATIPSRGIRVQARTGYFFTSPGADGGFPQAEVQSSLFVPLSDRSSLFMVGSGGTNFGNRTSVYQQFRLGGPLRLTAYSQNEFRGERYALGGVGYLRSIARLPAVLGKKIYVTGILERGGAFNGPGSTSYHNSASLGLAADTLLGPIVLGGSLGDGSRRAFYFSLGRLF